MQIAAETFFFCNYPPIISFLGVFRGVESAPIFFIVSLCALNKILALKSLEMPKGDTREFFFRNCPPIIICLRMFRAVESAPNFFIVSLCALNEIPALKSLEKPNAAERELFFRNYPPIISFLGVFWGVKFVRNFFIGSLRAVKEISALKSLKMPQGDTREFFFVTAPL